MKKLHISGKRKALGALLASLIIGASTTAALAEEAGDLSVFDENDAELSILEESSLMRKQLAHMLQGKKNFKEANYGDTIQSADKTEPKTKKSAVYPAIETDKSQTIPISSISNNEQENESALDSFSRSLQKPLRSAGFNVAVQLKQLIMIILLKSLSDAASWSVIMLLLAAVILIPHAKWIIFLRLRKMLPELMKIILRVNH